MDWKHLLQVGREVVGWLGWLVGTYFASILAWTIWKRHRPEHARRWMHWIASLKRFRERGMGTIERVWATSVALIVSAMLVFAATRPPRYPLSEERDVAVLSIEGDYRFTFQPVDSDNHLVGTCDNSPSRTCFTRDICTDYPSPRRDFPVGIILARMIHDDEGGCWSLSPDKHCGYFKKRYTNREPVFVDVAVRREDHGL